ncbi:MAG TPA: AAA family ATPase [Candidatus Nitrosopelagicus sp.]|uniref:Putative adenylate kinase n=1 Tax=uncultured marine crenarchaeote HF4000_APKG8O8 TaxID=455607 RepID=B3TBA3_9ARCH|nr:putative adenylate kinase [uncultured marine crenarchaeote HF4000_APKG8O8]HIO31972.1 AAA family ATPase [Candidatus Nitrosopelagicus sp.]
MIKSIIISGPPAVGKTTIAKGIAEEFGLTHLSGGDILKELAEEEGFKTGGDDWWDTQEGMNFLSQRQENSEFDKKVDDKLKKHFLDGNVVITSYTLPWLVEGGIKIWLEGSKENSAQRMTTRDNMSKDNALEIVQKRYQENKKIYKALYGFEFGEDLSVFDKVIETDGLDASQVLDIAKTVVRKLF